MTVVSPLARYLLPSETCVAVARRHWALLLPQGSVIAATWIVWAVVLDASAGSFVQSVAAFFYVFSGAWFAWLLGEWHIEQFVVTDKRVLLISGLLYRKVAVMPLAKVTDLTYERSPLGRMLGYGTFVMESAGQDQALSKVEFLPHPDQLYQRLSEELFGPGGRDEGDGMNRTIRVPGPPPRPMPPAPPSTAPPTSYPTAANPTAANPTAANPTGANPTGANTAASNPSAGPTTVNRTTRLPHVR